MQVFKSKPYSKIMTAEFGLIKFDSKGFYTAKKDAVIAFLSYAKGVELVKAGSDGGVESKPKAKAPARKASSKPNSFIGD